MSHQKPNILNKAMTLVVRENMQWGKNVTFGPNCKNVTIGYGCFIGNDVYIDVEDLHIGDYFRLHHGSIIHGKKCLIGHNNWVGHYTILDALGGQLTLGNNVGIGAHSQLWSHIKFGDRLAGCQWYSMDELEVGDDAWFVGHCIVTAITAAPRCMLMVGGVALEDMEENHIYAGVPAKDMTEKMGYQFRDVSLEEKEKVFSAYVEEYQRLGNDVNFINVVSHFNGVDETNKTNFNLQTREYLPRYSMDEYNFMRFLLYDKAKFVPIKKEHPD